MTRALQELARELSLPYYENALPAHDRFHANRVRDVALRLADDTNDSVDEDVLGAAAWLHDIGRPRERSGAIDDHDAWGARETRTLLEANGVSADRIEAVTHCVRTHSIRASSPEPETPEARLLFDADKLDAVGARGIVRLACIVGERSGSAGESHAVIDDGSSAGIPTPDRPDIDLLREWASERLDRLYTDPGRRVGDSRWRSMETFFDQFQREIEPEGGR